MPAYSPRAFFLLSQAVFGVNNDDRSFRAHTGTSPDVCSLIWNEISSNEQCSSYMRPVHLLWALHFLKAYCTEDVIAPRLGTTRKMYRKWVWKVLQLICSMIRKVVRIRNGGSSLVCPFLLFRSCSHSVFLYIYRSNGQTKSVWTVIRIDSVCALLMEPTFEFVNQSPSTLDGTRTSSKALVFDTKLLSLSMAAISFILMVHSCVATGLTSRSFETNWSTSLVQMKWLKPTLDIEESRTSAGCQQTISFLATGDRNAEPELVKRLSIVASSSSAFFHNDFATRLLVTTCPCTRLLLKLLLWLLSWISTMETPSFQSTFIKQAKGDQGGFILCGATILCLWVLFEGNVDPKIVSRW